MILDKMKIFTKQFYGQSIIHVKHFNSLFLEASFVNRKRVTSFIKFFKIILETIKYNFQSALMYFISSMV